MKSFATSSFGALTWLFLVLVNLSSYSGSVQAALLPRDNLLSPLNVPENLLPEYAKLIGKCKGDNNMVRDLSYVPLIDPF